MQDTPSIAPGVVSLSHPQSFYIHAPEGEKVGIRWTSETATVSSIALGSGLFRADLNPKSVDFGEAKTGTHIIQLLIDDQIYEREILLIPPVVQPSKIVSSAENGIAVAISEPTDELIIVRRNGVLVRTQVEDSPSDCALIDRKGRIAVTHRHSDELWIVESRKGLTEKQIKLHGRQSSIAVGMQRKQIAVGLLGKASGVQFLSLPELKSTAFMKLDFEPDWISFGQTTDHLIVSDRHLAKIHIFRRVGDSWRKHLEPIQLMRPPVTHQMSLNREKLHLVVTKHHDKNEGSNNHYIQDQVITINLEKWRIEEQFSTFGAENINNSPSLYGASPISMSFGKPHTRAIVFAGSNEAWFSDTSTTTGPYTHSVSLNFPAPGSIAHLGSDIWAISYPASRALQLINSEGRILREYILESEEVLKSRDPQALKIQEGELYFHESTRSGASCQSCHLDADSDFSEHDIGQGRPQPTLSVRGTAFTAPYLRGASYPSIASLEHVVLDILGGYKQTRADRGEKLEHFVKSLTRRTPRITLTTEETKKGLAAFVKASCNTCHSFPQFTNLEQISSSFLFGNSEDTFHWLDTPSLLSVSTSPPYLSDGRAKNLREIIGKYNKNNRHGDTASLSDSEKDALLKFLEAL